MSMGYAIAQEMARRVGVLFLFVLVVVTAVAGLSYWAGSEISRSDIEREAMRVNAGRVQHINGKRVFSFINSQQEYREGYVDGRDFTNGREAEARKEEYERGFRNGFVHGVTRTGDEEPAPPPTPAPGPTPPL